MEQTKKSKVISWIVFGVAFIAFAIFAIIMLPKITNSDTSALEGRVLTIRSSHRVEGSYETYIEFEKNNIARFSSDIGNEVKYTKRGDNLTFNDVYFQGKQYEKLKATIYSNSNYKDNDFFQYYFIRIYDGNTQIADTYPDDTVFEKWDIYKTFIAKDFDVTDEEPPEFMPDAHEEEAKISEIDQIALDFFGNVKTLTFNNQNVCIAVLNDDMVLTGSYQQVISGKLFLNFGKDYAVNDKYIEMKVTATAPKPSNGSYYLNDTGLPQYDPDYSNLTPPPYYQSGQMYIYWESQGSTFIIR